MCNYSHKLAYVPFCIQNSAIMAHIGRLSAFHETKNSFAVADARLLFKV